MPCVCACGAGHRCGFLAKRLLHAGMCGIFTDADSFEQTDAFSVGIARITRTVCDWQVQIDLHLVA